MATDGKKPNTLQIIQSHVDKLKEDLETIEARQSSLKKQKQYVEEEIYQKLDSLVDAVKKCHARATQHLEETYKKKLKKLEDVKERVNERKTKAENDLIVDHRRVEIPDIGEFSYTINVDEAMRSIAEIRPKINNEPRMSSWSIKLEKPDASTSAEKRGIEPTTSTSASGAQSDDVPPTLKKAKVEKKPIRTIQTLRAFVKCAKCRKPRCVYSDRGLSKDDQYLWNVVKGSLRFQCGGRLFHPFDEVLNVEPVDCSTLVHWHCFSPKARERNFPTFCYHCGHEMGEASKAKSEEGEDQEIHPVCRACSKAGIPRRIRQKIHRSSTKTSSSYVTIDEDDD